MRDKVQYIIIGTLSVAFWKTACNYFGGKFAFMVLLPYFCNEESKRSKRKLSSRIVFAERTKSTVYAKAVLFFCCFWCKCTYILHTKQ